MRKPEDDTPQRPATPADEDAGDRSLVRWMLTLTPRERLEWVQRNIEAAEEVRKLNPHLWTSAPS
jgi:hypothetical protein